MEHPKFTHDCNNCTFLGLDTDNNGEMVDMYFCPQGGMPTILMRFGSEGSEYTSAPISIINDNLDVYSNSPLLRNMLIAEDNLLWFRQEKDLV